MKSKYFKNLAKGLVIASAALALVNCNEATTAANDGAADVTQTAVGDPAQDPSQQPVTGPTADPTQTVADPTADPANPTADPTVDPTQQNPEQGQTPVTDPADPNTPAVDPAQPADTTAQVIPPEDLCLASSLPNACEQQQPVDTTVQIVDPTPTSSAAVENPASSSSEAVTPASSSSEQAVSSSSEEVKPTGGIFLAEGTDENKDLMQVEYFERTGDNGGGILAYPKQLSNDKKHAVVLWGPGGGENPNAYSGLIKRLASHGFIVVATSESPDGTGRGKPMLDWLAKKNTTPGDVLYGKVDMTKVGCSGHSMGGLQSEQMLINDDRVITAIMNNSGAFNHAEMTKVSPSKTIAIVYGEGGMERPNAEGDYNNNNVKAPACLIKMTGGQGSECQQGECGWGHGSGPWGGMAATVAWMRWHLGGEDFRKADFVGSTGKYIDGAIIGQRGKWKGQCKNF